MCGCAGTGRGVLRDALHLVLQEDGEVVDEQILLTSSVNVCAQQQELLDGIATLQQAPAIRWPNDWSDRVQVERLCEDQVARAELEASVYGPQYEVGHWRLRLRVWRDGAQGVEPGTYLPGGGATAGALTGDHVEVFADPYAAYRSIDYDCAEYASAYLDGDQALFVIPTTPTLEDLHESLDQSRMAAGELTIERDGGSLTLNLEGGELADDYGRNAGELDLETELSRCNLVR